MKLPKGVSLEVQGQATRAQLMEDREQLLYAAQICYRKHSLGDESINWEDATEILYRALKSCMGSESFLHWIKNL